MKIAIWAASGHSLPGDRLQSRELESHLLIQVSEIFVLRCSVESCCPTMHNDLRINTLISEPRHPSALFFASVASQDKLFLCRRVFSESRAIPALLSRGFMNLQRDPLRVHVPVQLASV